MKKSLLFAAAVLLSWFLLAVALRWIWPFPAAALFAAAVDPAVRTLSEKLHVRRAFASAVCVTGVLLLMGMILAAVTWRALYEVGELIDRLPELAVSVTGSVQSLRTSLSRMFASAPPQVTGFLADQLDRIGTRVSSLGPDLAGRVLSVLSHAVQQLPSLLLGIGTCILATYFLSARLDRVIAFIKRQIPVRYHTKAVHMRAAAVGSLGRWLKAQLLLIVITFGQLAISFCLLRVEYAVVLALLIGLLDALPVIGTGTVLLPWAAVNMIAGRYSFAIGLLVTYAVTVVTRNALEPKLVSAQAGVDPVVTLLAMYLGFRLLGVGGMILFPIVVMIAAHLHETGVIRLWK